jgi:Family of unknown function (DUF6505)
MTKLLRTLRLDPSDTFVFERAAEPGEWAVTGSVLFFDSDPTAMGPKLRAAFRAGFLGLESFGFSTLAEVAEIALDRREVLVDRFARALYDRFGAPSLDVATAAARDEITFAASLCDHEPGTVIAMRRILEGGEIREQFRTLNRRDPALSGADRLHGFARAFEFVEVVEPDERVGLPGLMDES